MAAGLIAFGAGLLLSSLIPASEKEREAADALKTAAEPMTTELTEAAKDMAEGLKEPAREAMENVKATATDAAEHVKAEGQTAAADVKDRATDAKDTRPKHLTGAHTPRAATPDRPVPLSGRAGLSITNPRGHLMAAQDASETSTAKAGQAPAPDDSRKPDSPTDVTKPSWKYIAKKTLREFTKDQCPDLAAALTYYAVLSLFPAMLALVSLLGTLRRSGKNHLRPAGDRPRFRPGRDGEYGQRPRCRNSPAPRPPG